MPGKRRPYMAASAYHEALKKPEILRAEPRAKRPLGRPSLYSDQLAHLICLRIANGESVLTICRDADMPDRGTIVRWMAGNALFASMIVRARELQADHYAEETIEIADNPTGDTLLKPDGTPVTVWENVQRSKLRCDQRRWYAAKLAPKKYGDSVTQRIVGEDGGPVLIQEPLTKQQIEREVSRLLEAAEQEIGIPTLEGISNQERLRNLMVTGQPMTPDLYRLTHQRKETAQ
jgi:hypothetical protein